MEQAERYAKLFQPGKIGPMTVKNRIVMPPFEKGYCTYEGMVTQRYLDYIEARAAGGLGLCFAEATAIDPRGKARTFQLGAWDDSHIPSLRRLADVAHKYDMKVATELYHGGRETQPQVTGVQLVSCSSHRPCPAIGSYPARTLTIPEIKEIIGLYADSARRTQEAGFDMVEVHGAHGYLVGQFLSPFTNDRTDEYGGSFENRMRFPLEVVAAVRKAVGNDYPVAYRMSGSEFVEGGLTLEDMKLVAKRLEDAGIDLIDVSGAILESGYIIAAPMGFGEGYFVHLGAGIKQAVSIPVVIANRLESPELAEQVLARGEADYVALGRGLHCDPAWPRKLQEGRRGEVRLCIACNVCSDQMLSQNPALCAINPETGLERENAIKPAAQSKNVVVIGAGPAGMEAARVLRLRGHQVTLLERQPVAGGLLRYAAMAPRMAELTRVTDFLWHEVNRLGVEVRLNTEATPALMAELGPDAIVVATGAKEMTPPSVVGIRSPNVVPALAVLDGAVTAGKRVVVMGSKLTGCKVAEKLAAAGHTVIVAELEKTFLTERWLTASLRHEYLKTLENHPNVELRADTTVEEIAGSTVILQRDGIQETLSDIDTVVLAVGYDYAGTLAADLIAANAAAEVYEVGDGAFPAGSLLEVMHSAARVARMI